MLKAFHRIPFFSSYCYYSTVHYQVLHSKKLKEFSLGENSDKAVLQYQEIAPSVILLEHTIVPESLQGKGFGKLLAEHLLCFLLVSSTVLKETGFFRKKPNPASNEGCHVNFDECKIVNLCNDPYAAFEYAIDQNLKVKISCNFVKKYLEKNPKPEFLKILSND